MRVAPKKTNAVIRLALLAGVFAALLFSGGEGIRLLPFASADNFAAEHAESAFGGIGIRETSLSPAATRVTAGKSRLADFDVLLAPPFDSARPSDARRPHPAEPDFAPRLRVGPGGSASRRAGRAPPLA